MEGTPSYRTYWGIWFVLLALTLLMIVLEAAEFPRATTILILCVAMLVKAGFIGGWFMHLKFERWTLTTAVVLGTLLTAAVLVFLLIPDGLGARPPEL